MPDKPPYPKKAEPIVQNPATGNNLVDYQAVFDSINVGLYIYRLEAIDDDTTLRMIGANRAADDFTGVPVEDCLGKTLDENFPGLREMGIPQQFARVVRSGEPADLELVRYGDERVPEGAFSVRAFPLPGSCVGVSFENVTKRLEIEAELKDSRTGLQLLFDNMLSGFAYHRILTDENGKPCDYVLLQVNRTFEQMTGLREADVIGRRVTEIHPDIKRMPFDWIGTYGKVALTGEPVEFEEYFEPQDHWYRISAYCPAHGYFAVTFEDVTERKEADAALRESEERFREFFERMPSAVAMYEAVDGGTDFQFTDFNQAAEQTENRKKANVIGKRLYEAFPTAKTFGILEFLQRIHRTGRAEYFPATLYTDETGRESWRESWGYRLPCGRVVAVYNDISERRRVLEELEKSELKFRLLAESIDDVFWMSTRGVGEMIYISPTYERLWGKPVEDLYRSPRSFLDTVHTDDLEAFIETIEQYHVNGAPYECDYRIVRSDGEVRWIHERGYPVLDFHGKQVMAGVCTDVTGRKLAEDKLREAVLQQNEVIRAGNVGLWDWDLRADRVRYSAEWKRQIGYEEHEISDDFDEWRSRVHPDDLAPTLAKVKQSLAERNQAHETEFRFRHKDGSYRWILARASILQDGGGNPVRMVGSHVDITERKHAEEELRENRAFLGILLDAIPIPVFYKDQKGKYIGVNSAFKAFFGVGRERLEGKTVFDVNPPELATIYSDQDKRLFETGGVQRYESQIRNACGALRDVIFNKAVFTDSKGKVGGLIGAILDITERKRIEEALIKSQQLHVEAQRVAGIGHWELDSPTGTPVWSEELYRIFGLDPAASAPSFAEHPNIIHPEDWRFLKQAVQRLNAEGTPFNIEFRFLRPGGEIGWMHVRGAAERDGHGNAGRMFGTAQDITDRKKAELELKESQDRLQTVIDFLPDATFVIDDRGIVRMWNRAMEKLTDIASENMIGKGDHAYSIPFYGKKRPLLIDLVLSWDESYTDKYLLLQKRGDGVLFSESYHPNLKEGIYLAGTARVFRNARGEPIGAIESLRNVTDVKKVENALRDSETRFRNLFNSIRDAIMVVDTEGRIIRINPAFTNLFGFTEEDILGKPASRLYESKQQFTALRRRIKKTENGYASIRILNYRKRNGETFPGETGVFDLLDVKGKATGFIGLIRNISERLEAEENLCRSQERLRSLVDNLFDAIVVTDRDGTIRFANPAAGKLFGRKSHHLIGTGFGFPITLDETFEIMAISPDGETRHAESRAVTADWNGETARLISLHDITERRLAAEQREQMNAHLQQLQRIESIGTLAGGIAHDFNNILSPIIGYSELVKDRVREDAVALDCLDQVYKAGLRAKDLVRQILSFSRQTDRELQPLMLPMLLKEVLKMLRSTLPTTIEIRQSIKSEHIIMGDATGIHQIIMNLCTNAKHAMEESGGILTVSVQDVTLPSDVAMKNPGMARGPYVRLRVEDTGTGIDPSVIDKIFEPYFTTKEKDRGTGLGLSVTHGIVKDLGGAVTVESRPAKGTVFDVYLPATELEEDVATRPADALETGNERILIVDDEPAVIRLLREFLEKQGYIITTSTDSPEALALFQSAPDEYDLLITDMTMPEMTGDRLAMECTGIRPDLPVIMVTGFSEKIDETRADEIGIQAFLYKPVTWADLAGKVRDVLDRNQARSG